MSQSSKFSFWQRLKQFLTLPLSARTNKSVNSDGIPSAEMTTASMDNDLQSRAKADSAKAYQMHPSSSDDSYHRPSVPKTINHPNSTADNQGSHPSHQAVKTTKTEPTGSQVITSNTDASASNLNRLDENPNKLSQYNVNPTNPTSPATITNRFREYLNQQHWHYQYHQPKSNDSFGTHHLSLSMKNDSISWVCLFRIQERSQLVAVYGILPFMMPESHRHAAMLLATQLNYDMMLGNIELDLADGEIRYKSSLDTEATGISDAVISYLIQSVIAMTTVTYELFKELLDNPNPSTDIEALLQEIRKQADTRTFFLASEQIQ